jgi:pSer/pThr/pTyr-binding forkhead associated (FHA) protein
LPPLVYCEDLESSNGTFVNETFIGSRFSRQRAYLLSDGDVINLRPNWAFQFKQLIKTPVRNLDKIQSLEFDVSQLTSFGFKD